MFLQTPPLECIFIEMFLQAPPLECIFGDTWSSDIFAGTFFKGTVEIIILEF